VIVTVVPPLLVMLAGRLCVEPLCTDPKLRLEGVTVNDPGVTAVATRGTERLVFEAFDVTERLPVKLPADCGEQVMLTVAL